MIKEVKIPEIAENVESGTVTEILVSTDDQIEEEQSLITVETDKASVEVPSSEAGIVQEIKVSKGDEVQQGTVILTVETENGTEEESESKQEEESKEEESEAKQEEKSKEEESEAKQEEKSKEEESEAKQEEESKEEKSEAEQEEESKEEESESEQEEESKEESKEKSDTPSTFEEAPASPLARRVARDKGVDIDEVEGSGPGGRITEEDIRARAEKSSHKENGKPEPGPELPDFSEWGEVSREEISNIRKVIAEKTPESWRLIPHVTHFDKANLALAEDFMEENAAEVERAGGKLTITAMLVKLAAEALRQFPEFNASLDMESGEIIYKHYYHIGLAVDTDHGLLLPVVRDVDQKSITEVAVEIGSLAEKARAKELSPEEMQGGCFTVTNLGGIGGTNFTPIIYHPQVAILGVSKASVEPVFTGGQFEPQKMLPLSLSYDHRLIDGASAARFMKWLIQALENPLAAFMN